MFDLAHSPLPSAASAPSDKMAPSPSRLRSFADDLDQSGSDELAALVRQVAAEVEEA